MPAAAVAGEDVEVGAEAAAEEAALGTESVVEVVGCEVACCAGAEEGA